MKFYKHIDAFSELRQLYWRLRAIRAYDSAARRKWYRRIKIEKDRLENLGFSAEHLRLYCRYMANPLEQCNALDKLRAFEAMLIEFAKIRQSTKLAAPQVGIVGSGSDLSASSLKG